jgi:hypothetical protein
MIIPLRSMTGQLPTRAFGGIFLEILAEANDEPASRETAALTRRRSLRHPAMIVIQHSRRQSRVQCSHGNSPF